jgi:hypothetical protein
MQIKFGSYSKDKKPPVIKSRTHEKSNLYTNWVLPRPRYVTPWAWQAYHKCGDSTTHHWPWQAETTFKNSEILVSFTPLLIIHYLC